MKVLSTDGAILNLSRFEAVRIYEEDRPIKAGEIAALLDTAEGREVIRGSLFRVLALSGLGRSGDPTETVIAEGSAVGILEVWKILAGVDRAGPFDLSAVIRTADAKAAAR